jgi:hypothetical protein
MTTNAASETSTEGRRSLQPPNVAISDGQSRVISESDIATRAYFLWEERGRPEGSPETDWFRAQRERAGVDKTPRT